MCIRDRAFYNNAEGVTKLTTETGAGQWGSALAFATAQYGICLLYTSDAADERSSVDLGGRRILKKKKNTNRTRESTHKHNKLKQESK